MSKSNRSCPRLSISCKGGVTQKHYRSQCDINSIVDKARRTGLVTHVNSKKAFYGDVSGVPDYQTALSLVQNANDKFMALPARVRDRFMNNPANLLDFLSKNENRDEAVKLGLIEPLPPAPKVEVPKESPSPK